MSFISKLKEDLKPSKFDAQGFSYEGAALSTNYFSTEFKTGAEWIPFGDLDDAPIYFEQLAEGSAIHGAILKTKAAMISGQGVLLNGVANSTDPQFKFLEKNEYGKYSFQSLNDSLAENYSISGAFAYVVTWNKDFTKIASYKPLNIKYLRAAVPNDDGEVESYYYSEKGFNRVDTSDMEQYFVYNQKDRAHFQQIVYEKDGFGKYYGTPSYKGGFDWILIDIELGTFHKSNIKNGLNPGLHFKFYTEPESDEEKMFINRQIAKTWMGALKTGRFVSTFSKNKDLATDVVPIETSGLDKQLLNLTELSDRKILSAHQLTSPLLAGISVSGQIGGNVELKTAFALWNKGVIEKMRQRIEQSLTKHIFSVNIPNAKIEIIPFNPLAELQDEPSATN